MLFTSIHYLLFFVLVIILYWMIPARQRWAFLLVTSLIFYTAHIPEYLPILVLSVLVNFHYGIKIGDSYSFRMKKKFLYRGIIFNILILALFKYADDLVNMFYPSLMAKEALKELFLVSMKYSDSPLFSIILPLGISFFTFTNISYLIDVKRGTILPERHAGYYAVYIMFFPKLIQGPIERAQHFLPQLRETGTFETGMAVDGLRLLLWGFFKKLVIAERLGVAVDHVFDNPVAHPGPVLAFAAVLYSFQIYLDFSSYIDMARGTAKMMGFNLVRNFNLPYFATSIKDFWDRWHISLSTWLRDYIFLPLAFKSSRSLTRERYLGIRTDQVIYAIAASVTFVFAGVWHGTGWNYIFWGGLFAFYLIFANMTMKLKRSFYQKTGLIRWRKTNRVFQTLVTFLLVTFTWIFFRSDNLGSAFLYTRSLFYGWGGFFRSGDWLSQLTFPGFTVLDLALVAPSVFFTLFLEYYIYTIPPARRYTPSGIVRWGFYYALLLILFVFGKFESELFIYFQF